MSQYDPSRSPGEEPRGSWDDQPPPDEGTVVIERPSGIDGAPASDTGGRYCRNPACGQPLGADVSFCSACGTPLETERSRPWLLVVGLVWALIAIGAYLLLYSSAFVIGRP